MNKKRRITSLILASLLLASCGSGAVTEDTTPAEDTTTGDTTTEAPETSAMDKLASQDFGGAEYLILSTNSGYGSQPNYDFEFIVDEPNGEIVNDAVYDRQVKVEERFNVKIKNETMSNAEVTSATKNAVLAGDTSYSLVCSPLYEITSLATGGVLANYYDFEDIDLSKPWWNQNATESLTVNGKIYLQTNFIQTAGVLASHCLFYNKNLAEKYNVGDLYDIVLSGKWTVDKLLEITEGTTTDLNGDSVYDANDQFGFIGSYGAIGIFHYGCDNPFLEISDSGVVTGMLKTERLATTVDKVFELCKNGNRSWARPISEEPELVKMFANGQALIYTGFFFDLLSTFRDMKDDFGLLPYPKFDEAQDGYYTAIHGAAPLIGIPLTVSDAKMVGVVTEALAIDGYENVRPALVETTLRNKLLRDEQSVQIYDMFFDGIKVELALVYRSTNDIFECICNLLSKNSSDLFSYADSREPRAVASYQKIIDKFYED